MRDAPTLLIGCLGSAWTGTCHTIRSLVEGQRPIMEPVVLNDAPNEIPHQYVRAGKARRQHG